MFQIGSHVCSAQLPAARKLILSYSKAEKLSYIDLSLKNEWFPIYKNDVFCGCVFPIYFNENESYGAVCLFDEKSDCLPCDHIRLMEPLTKAFHKAPAFIDLIAVAAEPHTPPSDGTTHS